MCGSAATTAKFSTVARQQTWTLRRCLQCGLHFTDPLPTPALLRELYSGDYHADLQTEGGTERAFGAKYDRYLEWLVTYLSPNSRVLDIGCSTGLMVKMLADHGYRAQGIEMNRSSAEWGRAHYRVTIRNEQLEDCAFEPASFDAVLLTDVLEHTLHPLDYLLGLRRYLAPYGVVLVTFPDVMSVESRYRWLMATLTQRSWLWKNCHMPFHIWEFTKPTALACFREAGFSVIDFRRSHETDDEQEAGLVKVMNLPISILSWRPLASRFGTQMEFIIRCGS
jgi:2-polyprenyl-3-methyl-5-hydroxy-6-metoxy-1,4-benzoquinol methylase